MAVMTVSTSAIATVTAIAIATTPPHAPTVVSAAVTTVGRSRLLGFVALWLFSLSLPGRSIAQSNVKVVVMSSTATQSTPL